MLLTAAAVVALCCVATVLVAKAAQLTMRALGLDAWDMLLWFGIAEWPMDELAARRVARER